MAFQEKEAADGRAAEGRVVQRRREELVARVDLLWGSYIRVGPHNFKAILTPFASKSTQPPNSNQLSADVRYDSSLSAHGLDDHAADLDGVGAGAVGVRADLDEAVVQREAPPDVRREDVGAVPQEGDLQVEALQGCDSIDIFFTPESVPSHIRNFDTFNLYTVGRPLVCQVWLVFFYKLLLPMGAAQNLQYQPNAAAGGAFQNSSIRGCPTV